MRLIGFLVLYGYANLSCNLTNLNFCESTLSVAYLPDIGARRVGAYNSSNFLFDPLYSRNLFKTGHSIPVP